VLRHLDFRRAANREAVAEQLNEFVERRLLTEPEARAVDVDSILWLAQSEVGVLLRENADKVRREMPVYAALPAAEGAAGQDQVMLRGRVDVLVPLADRVLLVDYKTDAITADEVPGRVNGYLPQVDAYASAVARIVGKPVEAVLVFLKPRVVHRRGPSPRPPPPGTGERG
jgi:ATP-dependent helicase/nuclease subunit A